ncbi:MAG: hypothetical protein J0M04_21515 [Verrucomicrobia bacterium]|nr:hypothetical protein [Verrucomicrobiota bacterium]
MKQIFKTYGILALSLVALFASGIVTGRLTAPKSGNVPPATVDTRIPGDWLDSASRALVRELDLNADQTRQVREQLVPVSAALHEDQERAMFQMHLRLLMFHDTLGASGTLSPAQTARLAASRAKLKSLIIGRFPDMVRGNPVLAGERSGE